MVNCPTPWKLVFDSRRHALTELNRKKSTLKDGQLRPYRCPCGSWHVTSMTRRQAKPYVRRAAA